MTTSDPIAFEQIDPSEGTVRTFRTDADLSYTPGDVVNTPRGVGVVNAVLTDHFRFPTADEDTRVRASSDVPAYIIGHGGRSAPYRASALGDGDLYRPQAVNRNHDALVQPIAEQGIHPDALEANWGKRGLLRWWSNVGGLWQSAYERLRQGDYEAEQARSLASKRKDMVLGTSRWRTRF